MVDKTPARRVVWNFIERFPDADQKVNTDQVQGPYPSAQDPAKYAPTTPQLLTDFPGLQAPLSVSHCPLPLRPSRWTTYSNTLALTESSVSSVATRLHGSIALVFRPAHILVSAFSLGQFIYLHQYWTISTESVGYSAQSAHSTRLMCDTFRLFFV
ncbi:hypothetical protein KEM48_004236 [Puccinia striiformis f. sp. tritici PST-130]|nr:hypothetical protein KEM48_004236 [Puccinia striiformis f. sp. tritici PST-130]